MVRFVAQASVLAVLVFPCFAASARAELAVTIAAPAAASVSGESLALTVTVASKYEIKTVRAAVADKAVELAEDESGSYTGTLSLGKLPKGKQTVTVTATDVYDEKSKASVTFMLDRAPVITLSADDVASPKLHLIVTCSDDDKAGCASLTVSPLGLKGTSKIDETVSLAKSEGSAVELAITATDRSGQTTKLARTVYVESSPNLAHVLTSAEGVVRDTDGSQVLVVSEDLARVFLESADGSRKIYEEDSGSVQQAFLAPGGALFSIKHEGAAGEVLWIKDDLEKSFVNVIDFQVRGKWLAIKRLTQVEMPQEYDLTLIDLESGIELLHAEPAASKEEVEPYSYALADNGDLVWLDADRKLSRFRASTVMSLDCCGSTAAPSGLVTDGVNIAYQTKDAVASHVLTSTGSETLCESAEGMVCGDYVLRNGWAVFGRPFKQGASTRSQVFRRAPDGATTKVSALLADTFPSEVSPYGEVLMHSENRRYLTQGSERPLEVSSTLGTAIWAGDWYVMLGHSLFRIDAEGVAGPADDGGVAEPADAGGMAEPTPDDMSDAGVSEVPGAPAGGDNTPDRSSRKGPGTTCSVYLAGGKMGLMGVLSLILTLVLRRLATVRRARRLA